VDSMRIRRRVRLTARRVATASAPGRNRTPTARTIAVGAVTTFARIPRRT